MNNESKICSDKINKIKNELSEKVDDDDIMDKLYEVCIEPCEKYNNTIDIALKIKDLEFNELNVLFKKINDCIKELHQNLEMIVDAITLYKENIPVDSVYELTEQQLKIIKTLGLKTSSEIKSIESNKQTSNILNSNSTDINYKEYSDEIKSIIIHIEKELKDNNNDSKYEIECFSEEGAKAFCKFCKEHFSEEIVCNQKNSTVVFNLIPGSSSSIDR